MKLGNGWERKLRRGSASLGLCILVLVAVLLLNVGMTALCTSQFWFIDLTPESTYTVYLQQTNLKKECVQSVGKWPSNSSMYAAFPLRHRG